jgi:aryl-alcohol dehydrogenase-like predicted oxidoreductase
VIPWSPLAGGWLSGKYRKGQPLPEVGRHVKQVSEKADDPGVQRRLDTVERLVPVAQEVGCTLSQLALAWNMAQSGITAPIIGPRTMEQLQDNLGALEVKLDAGVLERIDHICPKGQAI